MPRIKNSELKTWEKLSIFMIDGQPKTIEEFEKQFGNEIYMYRIFSYINNLKTHGGGVVKSIKNKREIVAYQLINVNQMKEYIHKHRLRFEKYIPNIKQKKQSQSKFVKRLSDMAPQDNQSSVDFVKEEEREHILS